MNQETVYAITGYPGAGKSTFGELAKAHGYTVKSMGTIVREKAKKQLKDFNSHDLGEWATKQKQKHGNQIVAEWLTQEIQQMESNKVVIEGLRTPEELEVLRNNLGNVKVVYIHAPSKIRLQRLKERNREGENKFTEKDLRERDDREDEWGVGELLKKEKNRLIKINNTENIKKLEDKVESVLKNQ